MDRHWGDDIAHPRPMEREHQHRQILRFVRCPVIILDYNTNYAADQNTSVCVHKRSEFHGRQLPVGGMSVPTS